MSKHMNTQTGVVGPPDDQPPEQAGAAEGKLLATNFGYTGSAVLDAALELGVFDKFDGEAKTPESVAEGADWSPEATRRLFGALEQLDLLSRADERGYLVPVHVFELLTTHTRQSIAGHLRAVYAARTSWEGLAETVRSGRRVDRLGSLATRAQSVDFFVRGGTQLLNDARQVAALSADTSAETVVVLYATGGEWALAQAEAAEHRRVYAVDTSEFLDRGRQLIENSPVADRITLVPSPPGVQSHPINAQLVLVPPILRFLDDESAHQALTGAVDSLAPDGDLLLVDVVSDPEAQHQAPIPMLNLSLLLNTPAGGVRTMSYYRDTLERLGAQVTGAENLGLLTVVRCKRR